MERTQQKENKSKESQEQTKKMSDTYLAALDYRNQLSSDGHHKYLVPSRRPPTENLMYLNEITFDAKGDYIKTFIGSYKRVKAPKAKIGKIRHSKDRAYVAIELEKDHLFGSQNFKTIEIILFKLT